MNVLRIRNEMRNGKTIFDLPLRVTFYARVSTDKDEQLNSLENQAQYYTQFIDAVVMVSPTSATAPRTSAAWRRTCPPSGQKKIACWR